MPETTRFLRSSFGARLSRPQQRGNHRQMFGLNQSDLTPGRALWPAVIAGRPVIKLGRLVCESSRILSAERASENRQPISESVVANQV